VQEGIEMIQCLNPFLVLVMDKSDQAGNENHRLSDAEVDFRRLGPMIICIVALKCKCYRSRRVKTKVKVKVNVA